MSDSPGFFSDPGYSPAAPNLVIVSTWPTNLKTHGSPVNEYAAFPLEQNSLAVQKLKDQITVKPSDCFEKKVMTWDGGTGWWSDGEEIGRQIDRSIDGWMDG